MGDTYVLVLPDEPVPVLLMNTVWADRRGIHDALATVDDLRRWLTDVDGRPVDPLIEQGDLEHFQRLRDALRRLAAFLTEDRRPASADVRDAVTEVNEAVIRATIWLQLSIDEDGLHRRSAGTGTIAMRVLSTIAAQAVDLFTGEDRARLRACHAPGCVLYFIKDHPRRQWCSPACGNRARVARHYQRHRP